MEVSLSYILKDAQSGVKFQGEARAVLDEKYLTLIVEFGEPKLFSYTDIIGITGQDYRIDLTLTSKETLTLSGLGYQYEDFLRELFKLRNELLLKYMLMEESLIQAGFEARFTRLSSEGQLSQAGNCEIRLYETALVVLPEKGDPIRLPFSYVSQISKGDYKLSLVGEFGETLELSMLGGKYDFLARTLSETFNKLMLRSQTTIKELIPEADPATVHKLAAAMKDGRAAKKKDLEALSLDLWRRLIGKIEEAGLRREYEFLEGTASKEHICIGLKRGLMGDLTGSYIWLLIPLRRAASAKLENAVAFEAFQTTESGPQQEAGEKTADEEETAASGKATYFFRIMSRQDYAQATEQALQAELEKFLRNINRCMVDINFRREPIFLSEEQLDNPKYAQYRYAVAKLPPLRTLRSQFIGRVIHSSFSQWKSDVTSLLDFNIKSKDDTAKWRKGAE